MTRRRLKVTDYTVGWVCALPIELAAAKAALDEQHEPLPHDGVDPNIYTLGRIGKHNVVLICLPAGQIGIGAAAAGAARLRSKFNSVHFGLMVGDGGGVPSPEADIRLGDVVISQPYREHGGVVQYDFGKTGKDGHLTRTGALSPPPKILLNALAELRANRYLGLSTLAAHLATFDDFPKFSRAAAGPDVLFESEYIHDGGTTCESCDKKRVVNRAPRKSEDTVVHYGTVASGNQVMKDGITRDQLSAKLGGVICFEMEAAGLMNDFPCLTVRGICDYSDSHKNKTWQPFAAATAAACAKEILLLIPATEHTNQVYAAQEVIDGVAKYFIPFSLKGVPVAKFAPRMHDTKAIEKALLLQGQEHRRRIMALHGLGEIGKTQLAADFARRHQRDFSAIFWLDGSSESSLKESLGSCASRIPVGQIHEASRVHTIDKGGNIDVVVKDVLGWLSLPNNSNWLVVMDNVDRDYRNREEDAEAYDVLTYLPEADHGSVLITTRLPHLGQLGSQWEVRKADISHSRSILETWYGKSTGEEATELLALLDGLPLALAQAGAYMNENLTSIETYTRLYKEQWKDLMGSQDARHAPLRNYARGSVATTWIISFSAIKAKSEAAANLLLLWSHLDNKGMWRGLLSAAPSKSDVAAERISAWIGDIAKEETEFIEAIALLRRYSLIEDMEDQYGYAMHPVVHQWAYHVQDEESQTTLSWISIIVLGLAVPGSDSETYFPVMNRLIPHVMHSLRWIKKISAIKLSDELLNCWIFLNFGKIEASKTVTILNLKALEKVFGPEKRQTFEVSEHLGMIYAEQGRTVEAEAMLKRAQQGLQRLYGPESIESLHMTRNLAVLYLRNGRMDEGEPIIRHLLQVYTKQYGPDHYYTIVGILNLALCIQKQGRLEEAKTMLEQLLQRCTEEIASKGNRRYHFLLKSMWALANILREQRQVNGAALWYTKALFGHEEIFGKNHPDCQAIRKRISSLEHESSIINPTNREIPTKEHEHIIELTIALAKLDAR